MTNFAYCSGTMPVQIHKSTRSQQKYKSLGGGGGGKYTEKHIKNMMYFLKIGAQDMPRGNNVSLMVFP